MRAHEKLIIVRTLAANGYSRTRTAAALGITRAGLWKRMRALAIGAAEAPRTTPGRPKKIT